MNPRSHPFWSDCSSSTHSSPWPGRDNPARPRSVAPPFRISIVHQHRTCRTDRYPSAARAAVRESRRGQGSQAPFNRGSRTNPSFFRNSRRLECDLLHGNGDGMGAIEIKSGATVVSDWFDSLNKVARELPGIAARAVVYGGSEHQARRDGAVFPLADLGGLLERLDGRDLPEGRTWFSIQSRPGCDPAQSLFLTNNNRRFAARKFPAAKLKSSRSQDNACDLPT